MDIIALINQLAFPAFCCIAMGWYVKDQSDKHRQDIQALAEIHSKAEERMIETVNNNTLALTKLTERLGVEQYEHGSND